MSTFLGSGVPQQARLMTSVTTTEQERTSTSVQMRKHFVWTRTRALTARGWFVRNAELNSNGTVPANSDEITHRFRSSKRFHQIPCRSVAGGVPILTIKATWREHRDNSRHDQSGVGSLIVTDMLIGQTRVQTEAPKCPHQPLQELLASEFSLTVER